MRSITKVMAMASRRLGTPPALPPSSRSQCHREARQKRDFTDKERRNSKIGEKLAQHRVSQQRSAEQHEIVVAGAKLELECGTRRYHASPSPTAAPGLPRVSRSAASPWRAADSE